MDTNSPFSQENFNNIFKTSLKYIDRLTTRESGVLEFKKTFGYKSLQNCYKTFAAFSNTKGGYFIFGVANHPRKLLGLEQTSLTLFQDLDPEILTRELNRNFAPEIMWDIHEYEFNGMTFGIL